MNTAATARRRVTSALLALAVAGGVGLLSAPSAMAAKGPGGRIITCTVKNNDPHGSRHVTGTINSTSTVTCTGGNVESIYLRTHLHRKDGTYWSGTSKMSSWVSSQKSNSATSCKAGPAQFKTQTYVEVVFPEGFTPRTETRSIMGPAWMGVACGGNPVLGPDGEVPPELPDDAWPPADAPGTSETF